ncbi:hypothetical protein BAUCODRAFT_30166 [Baudoinia panamericana UAMH 10762]|uniref:Calpain catalytic domain-containing protein n=1 Tax=Baudoinia panamericana (strain UAMH 10762) TaxID=717646 RepID=M2NKT7_BAUPA|nr:uncharacterized protein BAUCODRAFT_30166 [Baudoinia panamericana UAMH 10762]EMC99760.1 hypothetical protein BAUCODRAFT_30166 [Baudoinia panamericana UAMH 10762]
MPSRPRSIGSRSDDEQSNAPPPPPPSNNRAFILGRLRPPPRPPTKDCQKPPQEVINDFWSGFKSAWPGKISSVLPDNYRAKRLRQRPDADEGSHNAVESYEEAARICRQKVDKIVKECRRVNQKYRDPHFDIEQDFYQATFPDCLRGLVAMKDDKKLEPKSVKRVNEIFENPRFYIAGPSANDVRQGRNGDCWLMSALGTISNSQGLIEKICVARNEEVGVYGFVFHRDGTWYSEVVDDKLYLMNEDFYDRQDRNRSDGIANWISVQNPKNVEKEYQKRFQTGSKALYFAQCSDPNETWLPLLEKAFAKAHGDYLAVEGGFVGEAIEDLTGGVTSELHATDILSREDFWENELSKVNRQFLFGCGQSRGFDGDRRGIQHRHAYSVMEAREVDGKRLVKLRNPWGNTEWKGAWSDGSEEWNSHWLDKLGHKFSDDGVFWISYEDLLDNYQHFDRTRLFDQSWQVTQQWISLSIPWSIDYHDTHFEFDIAEEGQVVVVLSQLDDRYFVGLEGQYTYTLSFRLHKKGDPDYLVRSPSSYDMYRSVSTEVVLQPGTYIVMMKVTGTFIPSKFKTEDVVRTMSHGRREKLLAIGLSYDLAHAKAQVVEHDKLVAERENEKRRAERKEKAKANRETIRKARKKHELIDKKRMQRVEAKRRAQEAERAKERKRDQREGDGADADDEAGETEVNRGSSTITDVVTSVSNSKTKQDATESVSDTEAEKTKANRDPSAEASTFEIKETPATPAYADGEQPPSNEPAKSRIGDDAPSPELLARTDSMARDEGRDILRPLAKPTKSVSIAPFPSEPPSRTQSWRTMPDSLGSLPRMQEPLPMREAPSRRSTGVCDPLAGMYGIPPAPPPSDWLPPPPQSNYLPERRNTFDANYGPPGIEFDDADFSWDSELDAPIHSDDEREAARKIARPDLIIIGEDDNDQFAGEPWNAVCVVGLRVYAKAENKIEVRVATASGQNTDGEGTNAEKDLDRDDPAVDLAEGTISDREQVQKDSLADTEPTPVATLGGGDTTQPDQVALSRVERTRGGDEPVPNQAEQRQVERDQ